MPPRAVPAGGSSARNLNGRIERMVGRRDQVERLIEDDPHACAPPWRPLGIPELRSEHMGRKQAGAALHLVSVRALSDAHISMHKAEHARSQSFAAMLTGIPDTDMEMRAALDRSCVLNTFVYVAGRTMPWVFAEDAPEHAEVFRDYEQCYETLTPTYCMWIASVLSLLALHRRAYTYWTLGERDRAFRDFYKLTRLLRDLRDRARQRAARVPGTRTLIEGLTASAEHHIGRIYRGQHAHRIALRYFDRASMHLKGWEDHAEVGEVLRNSRWRVSLLIGQGKANYELGRMKRSLLFYARAWRAFLLLAESEGPARANIDVVSELIEWLSPIQGEPELSKSEISARMMPLVDQFETVLHPVHLRRLAADIMMRVGHLLFILKLPHVHWDPSDRSQQLPVPPDHLLAYRCMRHAAKLDPAGTQIAADLLKARHNARHAGIPSKDHDPPAVPFQQQWPSGGGRFEEAARVIEYILQRILSERDGGVAHEQPQKDACNRREIARRLLGSFLAHTDSSNVKLAQVYRYLMEDSRRLADDADPEATTLDVVCLRRYSSFFPFLPRPVAFRALGGGYLVQVREPGSKPFGIAVDPGPSFLDNLYRCGYSLAHIQMVIVTHDHADHVASLDALLTLVAIRMAVGGGESFSAERRLTIVGNPSIVQRYSFYNEGTYADLHERDGKLVARKDAVRVVSFGEIADVTRLSGDLRTDGVKELKVLLEPRTLRIEPVRTVDHHDAGGHMAQGFMLSVGAGSQKASVFFTSDTGAPPARGGQLGSNVKRNYATGSRSMKSAAASADLVVAHLSSVPLRELRVLAELDEDDHRLVSEFSMLWDEAVQQSRRMEERGAAQGAKDTRFLLQQVQFGFRTRAREDERLAVSPLSPTRDIRIQTEKHLFLTGLLDLAEHMQARQRRGRPPLLLIGELREELGTFRTRIAAHVNDAVFARPVGGNGGGDARAAGGSRGAGKALTADIGLRVRVQRRPGAAGSREAVSTMVLCSTCDLDNDLTAAERFHRPADIREVCVKGENEGVFYNCPLHDPGNQLDQPWVESVERYDVFCDY